MKPQDRTRIVLRCGLDTESKIIAVALADYLSTDSGTAWPSMARLARDTGLTERTIRRRIAAGTSAGWLTVERRDGFSTRYQIEWSSLALEQVEPRTGSPPHPGQGVPPDRESPRTDSPPTPDRESAHPGQPVPPTPDSLSHEVDQCEGTTEQTSKQTTRAPAVAADPTPTTTPEADREHEPTSTTATESRPDASGEADGVRRGAERGEQAPATGQPPTGDPRAEPHPGRAGPAVAAWEAIDGIRRRNVKGSGKLVMTAAMGKMMKERLREHSADDLALMVEWVTGCRCSAKECRACSWLQPKGYTHPKTYLRPDNCSEYLDLAKQAGATSPTSTSEPMDWTESDAARLVVQRVLDSAAELHHRDERILWLAKRTITHIGKRAAWRGKGSTVEWISAWRKEWPASVAAYEQKQQQAGAAK